VAQKSALGLLASGHNSLIVYFLSGDFSQYAAVAAIVSVLITLILASPLIVADRQRRMNLLQYASSIGRRIFGRQFAAIAVSAFALSLIAACLSYLPVLSGRAADYWDAA
jgi:energy-converting hydrogenase Eha subunit A